MINSLAQVIPLATLANWQTGSQVAGVARSTGPFASESRSLAKLRLADLGYEVEAQDTVMQRLEVRDADRDSRRMCVECLALDRRGKCHEAAAGRVPGAASSYTPVPDMLQNCPGFKTTGVQGVESPRVTARALPSRNALGT